MHAAAPISRMTDAPLPDDTCYSPHPIRVANTEKVARSALHEGAARCASQNATIDESLQNERARRGIEPPQALGLRSRHAHAGHFAIFGFNTTQDVVERYVGYWFAISYSVGGSQSGVHVCLLVMTNQKAKCDPSTVVVSPSETEHHPSAARCKMNGSSQDESCHPACRWARRRWPTS